MASKLLYSSLLLSTVCGSLIRDPGTTVKHPRDDAPCAQIAKLQAMNQTNLPATIALQCLQSVPLDLEGNALQLAGLHSFLEFQSDLAYLKDPPSGYLYPGVDLLADLTSLYNDLANKTFENEYQFQEGVYNLIVSAHDGHLLYVPDVLAVFAWQRENGLISASSDGVTLPEIYASSDTRALAAQTASAYKPSPITRINDQDVEEYLNTFASRIYAGQDPDANYNTLMYSHFRLLDDRFFGGDVRFPGNETSIQYANGTTVHWATFAVTSFDFSGVTDGTSFFNKFCNSSYAKISSTNATALPSATSSIDGSKSPTPIATQVPYAPVPLNRSIAGPQYFPSPIVAASDLSIVGYFPSSLEDVTVLSISTFAPAAPYVTGFEDTTRELLATAKSSGKKKLVIDLRGNGGGIAHLAYDMFRQLFPSKTPYGATNFRANEILADFGPVISSLVASANDTVKSEIGITYVSPPWDYHGALNADDQPFTTWSDFFGPHVYRDDNFTSLVRYNLSDPLQHTDADVYGYVNDTLPQPQTFAAEDIILLQDGFCASTCALFVEFMKTQAGVRQVVVGGRKQNGPMQGVGGTKGAEVSPMFDVAVYLEETVKYGAQEQTALLAAKYSDLEPTMFQTINRAALGTGDSPVQASFNMRNNIRRGDNTNTPLQFVYEAADCRFFYTPQMYKKQELVWVYAVDLMWGNATCVPGSTNQTSSAPGTIYILSPPPAEVNGTQTSNSTSTAQPYSGASGRLEVCYWFGIFALVAHVISLF